MSEPMVTCAICGVVFVSDWSEEEAMAEAQAVFGEQEMKQGTVSTCDDCYIKVTAWARERGLMTWPKDAGPA